jgi:hypothetical protein
MRRWGMVRLRGGYRQVSAPRENGDSDLYVNVPVDAPLSSLATLIPWARHGGATGALA